MVGGFRSRDNDGLEFSSKARLLHDLEPSYLRYLPPIVPVLSQLADETARGFDPNATCARHRHHRARARASSVCGTDGKPFLLLARWPSIRVAKSATGEGSVVCSRSSAVTFIVLLISASGAPFFLNPASATAAESISLCFPNGSVCLATPATTTTDGANSRGANLSKNAR